ncbi:hypothetical protein LTR49_027945 [Elasticomyces elasticus]|nr:hypothetical protein LTR49_027945 [Elasticomyces elasticus]
MLDQSGLSTKRQRPMRFRQDLPHKRPKENNVKKLQPDTLTILKLSDPLIDTATVYTLFDICLSIAKEKRPCGHKPNFTDRQITPIREKRHMRAWVHISTQEPMIIEKPPDLCSVSVVHHFKSPAWFRSMRGPPSGASSLVNSDKEQAMLVQQVDESLIAV